MPATSAKQKRFMDAAAHNPAFAKEAGIPVGVAQEFSKASKGKRFGGGSRPDLQKVGSPKTDHGKMNLFKEGGVMKESKAMMKKEIDFMQKKGAPKAMIKHEKAEAKGYAKGGGIEVRGKTKGKMIKMKKGGMCK